MSAHSFTVGSPANRQQSPLTLDELRRKAPAAFALEAHESRSARYTYVPTVAIIEGMQRAGYLPFSATQSRSRIEGKSEFTKHMIRFRSQDVSTTLVVGDTVPEVVLINSHDGTSAYQLSAGFYRLVCSNGLMVSAGMQDEVKVKHFGGIIDAVIEGSNRITEGSGRAIEAIQQWNRLQLTSGEQSAFAEAAHTIRFADSEGKITTSITAAQLLAPRRYADAGNSLYSVLNRVQENVIKGGLHGVQRDPNGRRLRAVSTLPIKGIDSDVRLNKALWTLAEKMAELKAA